MHTRVAKTGPWILAAAGLVTALAFVYVFPPETSPLYPRCLLFTFTGLSCPGCGGLRAMHQLMHGEFVRAIQLNPLILVLVPIALVAAAKLLLRRENCAPYALLTPAWLWVLFALSMLFAVARNLPMFAAFKP